MPREFSEWEWDWNEPPRERSAAEVAAIAAREAARESADAWAAATAPVTFARDWWRAIARPVGGSHEANSGPAWDVFAEENRPGPAFNGGGEFVGRVEGATPPDADTVAAMVAEWENCGE